MRTLFPTALIVFAMTGCGSEDSSTPTQTPTAQEKAIVSDEPEGETTPSDSSTPDDAGTTFTGIQLDMWDTSVRPDGLSPSTFRVKAATGYRSVDNTKLFLNDLKVIIDRDTENEVLFEAGTGVVDEQEEFALLQEGVRIQAGVFTIDLEDARWDNKASIATSEKPVTIGNDETHLVARKGLVIDPNAGTIELYEAEGHLNFEGKTP